MAIDRRQSRRHRFALPDIARNLMLLAGGDPKRAGPRTAATPVFPPLEGEERVFRPAERMNYRELAVFRLPDSASLPSPSEDQDGREFRPPETPECPRDREALRRPLEGFQVCYPSDWEIDGHGYVATGVDERWYAAGLYRFGEDGHERAHVSIYTATPLQPVGSVRGGVRASVSGEA